MMKDFCCMPLHTAGKVIGSVWSVFSFLSIIGLSIGLGSSNSRSEDVFALSILLAMSVLEFLASALLIFGSMENRHLFLLPWLVVSGITLADAYFCVLAKLITLAEDRELFVVIAVPFAGLFVYMYFAVLSLFQLIRAFHYAENPPN